MVPTYILFIATKNIVEINDLKMLLENEFEMKDLVAVKRYSEWRFRGYKGETIIHFLIKIHIETLLII